MEEMNFRFSMLGMLLSTVVIAVLLAMFQFLPISAFITLVVVFLLFASFRRERASANKRLGTSTTGEPVAVHTALGLVSGFCLGVILVGLAALTLSQWLAIVPFTPCAQAAGALGAIAGGVFPRPAFVTLQISGSILLEIALKLAAGVLEALGSIL